MIMQVNSDEIHTKFVEDFGLKLNLNHEGNDLLPAKEEEEEEEEEEFSFKFTNLSESPASADEIFVNGQIRPVFPLFDQSLLFTEPESEPSSSSSTEALRPPLKKLFVEEEAEGPYCTWTRGKAVETTPEGCKKSNSTGFSKLWRFKERVVRSNSDGKDAFVFLDTKPKAAAASGGESKMKKSEKIEAVEKKKVEVAVAVAVKKGKKNRETTPFSAAYMRNRKMKEGDKRKSYLPYRRGVVGFFTNVNGLSRNVHPF